MRKRKAKLVTISTLALSAACGGAATVAAAVKVSCSRNFFLGLHSVCGTGSLVINPDSSTVLSGCLISGTAPQPARCKVFDGGGKPVASSVVVNFTATSINIKNGGTTAKVDNFLMQHSGTATAKTQFTFTPTEVKNTVTLDVGGTFHFDPGLATGTYTGNIKMSAN